MKPKWHELFMLADWEQFLNVSDSTFCVLIKHSTACPISYNGYKEFDSFCRRNRKKPALFGLVNVIENREVSNAIANDLGLKHESPQVIFIYKRKVIGSRTHWAITLEWMEEQFSIFSKERT